MIRFPDLVRLLYAINTELFVAAKSESTGKSGSTATYRMLQYEDYKTLNRTELEILLSLLDLRYGHVVRKLLRVVNAEKFGLTANNTEQVRRLLGGIQVAIDQFDKTRSQFETDQKKDQPSQKDLMYTSYTIWNSLSSLLNVFVSCEQFPILSNSLAKLKPVLDNVNQVHEVYNQVLRRNFAGATQTCLSLIDSLFYGLPDSTVRIPANVDTIGELLKEGGMPAILYKILDNASPDEHLRTILKQMQGLLVSTVKTGHKKDSGDIMRQWAILYYSLGNRYNPLDSLGKVGKIIQKCSELAICLSRDSIKKITGKIKGFKDSVNNQSFRSPDSLFKRLHFSLFSNARLQYDDCRLDADSAFAAPISAVLAVYVDTLSSLLKKGSITQYQKTIEAMSDSIARLGDSMAKHVQQHLATLNNWLMTIPKIVSKDEQTYLFSLDSLGNASFAKTSPFAALFFENDRHAVQIVQKLAGFLNDVALAQNDQQLAKVVESYAMPAGSYKRKRNNWWSLDLNAFAGGYGGYEKVFTNGSLKQTFSEDGYVYGLMAPIGISLSKTWGNTLRSGSTLDYDWIRNPDKLKLNKGEIRMRNNFTMTLSLSLIDIGAAVSYRFNNQDGVLPQKLNFAQVFSPGLHLAVALPNTPLVVSGGIQFAPLLRSVTDSALRPSNTGRVYLGVLFDLPLFNLWEQKRIVTLHSAGRKDSAPAARPSRRKKKKQTNHPIH